MKTSRFYGYLAFLLLIYFLMMSVFAAPGLPHQFKGTVTINGSPAPDGTNVNADIENYIYNTNTVNGTYGIAPNSTFFVRDPNGNRQGKTIKFLVENVLAETFIFENAGFTELNLAITRAEPPAPPTNNDTGNAGGGGGGGGGGGSNQETNLFEVDKTLVDVGEEVTVSVRCYETNGCELKIDGQTATTFQKNHFNALEFKTSFDSPGEKILSLGRARSATIFGTKKITVIDPNAEPEVLPEENNGENPQNSGQESNVPTSTNTNDQSNPTGGEPQNNSIAPPTPTGFFGLGAETTGILQIVLLVVGIASVFVGWKKYQGKRK